MAYTYTNSKGQKYILHAQKATLKNNLARTIYFFAKKEGNSPLSTVPEGFVVAESRNGLPVLKREK